MYACLLTATPLLFSIPASTASNSPPQSASEGVIICCMSWHRYLVTPAFLSLAFYQIWRISSLVRVEPKRVSTQFHYIWGAARAPTCKSEGNLNLGREVY
ncbi:hypothetical protein F5Y05DRAFT_395770 [Hypoxylon sp. FL0543]|nr:hypothetical protein F5Y05DRAFT_395770 [Hypoxylon sp. FL0543]